MRHDTHHTQHVTQGTCICVLTEKEREREREKERGRRHDPTDEMDVELERECV